MTDPIAFGLNLSFCVKRWVTSGLWAPLVRERMGVDLVQFSLDLVDPMWPSAVLDRHADTIRRDASVTGITIHSAFIGLAHYTFNQLLHPDPDVRDYAEAWLGRAYAFAARAGIKSVGGPLGATASRIDGREADAIPDADYADLIARMIRLADRAKTEGLTRLYVEPTPLRREWPWTVAQARRMMDDVSESAVAWNYCLDWGHGTVEPLYGKAGADMEPWLSGLRDVVGALHVQQTDFQFDRHWDFTTQGRVDPAEVASLVRRTGLAGAPVFLEVFYPFEQDDASILDAVEKSASLLRNAFA
ncbi:sugar phosphate isomerase/epimerase family protein [Agrobacterium tumefaciens]|uniref:sugar phosphate isomerase/epimerase family protein n=1 Tax=Agrobacterium tumefaciens TaxID=358 RepID=UPI00045A7CD3|nr:TIM barrel protein [Agrobacterium tumefaciens]CDN92304.1 D-erythrulose 4-phosphate dehydrogenase [Agrobacterium tumefaciens]